LSDDLSPMLSSQWDPLQSSQDIGYSDPIHSAVPLVASQVSLPSVAGTARLLDLLPPHLASLYSSPDLLLRPVPARVKARPGVLDSIRFDSIRFDSIGLQSIMVKRPITG